MQIEAGKFYRNRQGNKIGPLERFPDPKFHWKAKGPTGNWLIFEPDGTNLNGKDSDYTLVAEWTDEPAPSGPTTTNKGVYGRIAVSGRAGANGLAVSFVNPEGVTGGTWDILHADELREAGTVLLRLAYALEEGK